MTTLFQEEMPNLHLERIREGCAPNNTFSQPFLHSPTAGTGNGSGSKVKVLVAHDEQVIADTLALILDHSGFETRAVYGGKAAVNALRSFAADVLISDAVMPEISGIDAAIAIQAQRPGCKVLLLAGQPASADLLHKARAQGHFFEILAKPVHPMKLLGKLREVLSLSSAFERVQAG